MKRWYVLQVYAGYEESIKKDMLRRIHEEGLGDQFGDISSFKINLTSLTQLLHPLPTPNNEDNFSKLLDPLAIAWQISEYITPIQVHTK